MVTMMFSATTFSAVMSSTAIFTTTPIIYKP
jgi:hypothetical protein